MSALPPSVPERVAAGKRLRTTVPRRELGVLSNGPRDPLGIIAEQNATRLPVLVSMRTERMSQSPFAFYRGTAAIMAADLAGEATTNLLVPACGDAHLANFGFYASPQRTLVFDLNDFDEAAWAPWEWDLKRLVASIVVAGQATDRAEAVVHRAVRSAVRSYAGALRRAVELSPRNRYFAHFDAHEGTGQMRPESRKVLDRAIKQATKRTGERATRKLTETDASGVRHFVTRPPTMTPLAAESLRIQQELVQRYLQSVHQDIRLLMRHYAVVDSIRRVVGVGSVGTRCSLTLFQDGDGHTLILQSKEAGASVLEQYGGVRQPAGLVDLAEQRGQGARVVALQRVLQAVSDPFLGSLRYHNEQGRPVELYVRQFHDMKGGIDAEELEDEPFETYADACAITLARAHSQAPAAAEISGYLGSGGSIASVLLDWGYAYADRSRADYAAFVAVAGQTESSG